MFAGISYSKDLFSAAWEVKNGPQTTFLIEGMQGWKRDYRDSLGQGDNTHHYAAFFFLGYFYGKDPARFINVLRDSLISDYNAGDLALGDLAASQGNQFFSDPNLTPSQITVEYFSVLAAPGPR